MAMIIVAPFYKKDYKPLLQEIEPIKKNMNH